MNQLYIGQNSSGKTTNMKKHLKELKGNVIVLDFGNNYDDFDGHKIELDDVNPLLDELGLIDVKALNAGYLAHSQILYTKAIDAVKEIKANDPSLRDIPFSELEQTFKQVGIVERTIELLQSGFDGRIENPRGKELNQKVPMKKYGKHKPLEDALSQITEHKRVILKSKSMHSDHLRAVTFIILSRLSRTTNESYYVVGDDLSSLFNNGNISLFSETINPEKLHFILAFNKMSNVPDKLIPEFDEYFIHKIESNSEISELESRGILTKKSPKKLGENEYIKVLRSEIEKIEEFDEIDLLNQMM